MDFLKSLWSQRGRGRETGGRRFNPVVAFTTIVNCMITKPQNRVARRKNRFRKHRPVPAAHRQAGRLSGTGSLSAWVTAAFSRSLYPPEFSGSTISVKGSPPPQKKKFGNPFPPMSRMFLAGPERLARAVSILSMPLLPSCGICMQLECSGMQLRNCWRGGEGGENLWHGLDRNFSIIIFFFPTTSSSYF